MANNRKECDGWGAGNSEKGHEEIVQGWGCVEENNNKKETQWEHAGHLDNFLPVGNNTPHQLSSSSTRGKPANRRPNAWKPRRNFGNGRGGGGWRGKGAAANNQSGGCNTQRACNNGGGDSGWKGKRAAGDEIGGWNAKRACSNGGGGDGWKGKRAESNEIGGCNAKRGCSNGSGGGGGWNAKRAESNGGSQVSNGVYRVGRVQTLPNSFNGHRVSLHFPIQSPHLQRILREDFTLPPPRGFQGHFNDHLAPPLQVNRPPPPPPPVQVNNDPRPPPRQVNGPPPPPTPPSPPPAPVNAMQVYQPPVEDRVVGKKVRVTHTPGGSWVMEVEEFR